MKNNLSKRPRPKKPIPYNDGKTNRLLIEYPSASEYEAFLEAFEAELVSLVKQKRENLKRYDNFEPSYSLVCGQLDLLCEILGRTEKDVLGEQT